MDEDGAEIPRSRYRLRSSASPYSPKTRRYISPLHRHSSGDVRSPPGSPKGKIVSPPVAMIQELKNLYCCNLPNDLMNRDLLRDHFSQFGQVVRLYLSVKRSSCTVHFKTHEAAKLAKLNGNKLKGFTLHIFWSKPVTKPEKINVTEVEDAPQTPKVVKTRTSPKQVPSKQEISPSKKLAKSEKKKEKQELHLQKKKYELPETVADELQAMVQSDDYEILKPPKVIAIEAQPEAVLARKKKILAVGAAASRSRESSLLELLELWISKAKLEFHSAEERYQILELRDKILRIRRGKQSDLSKAEATRGICQDMCPEKERYQRESRQQIAFYEQALSVAKEMKMNHALAVKQYSRSSADQEEPLPHDLRPVSVLRKTMDYLLVRIMDRCDDKDENLGEWYHFVWDRTRGIRKDITQQELCDMDAVNLLEECVRFHIHCSERLVSEKISVFDNKINSENLTKCLQTLKYMYHDMALKGVTCNNEAEFRGYVILLNLNDSNFLWELKELREEIVNSEPVQFAMKVSIALNSNNYVEFFQLVNKTTYLNACILLRYFNQIRSKALRIIQRSYSTGSRLAVFSLGKLTRLLAFEDVKEAVNFCNDHGLSVKENSKELIFKHKPKVPSQHLPTARAIQLIESKRRVSVGETIKGCPLTTESFENCEPCTSFNPNGTLKKEVVNILSDQSKPVTLEKPFPEQEEKPVVKQEKQEEDAIRREENARQKEIEMEKLRHQEEAIREAEINKCNEIMQEMMEEIIHEEFEVFCERLDNVAILDLDEILLDVMCNMTRDAFKEVVTEEEEENQKRKEEERKCKEEEERKQREEQERKCREEEERKQREEQERKHREEQERKQRQEEEKKRKIIEEIAQKTTDQIVEITVSKAIRDIVIHETNLHNTSVEEVKEIVQETVCQDSKLILKEAILKSKLDYLAERRKQYCCKKYFNLWRRTVEKVKEKRRSMEDFPAWFSPLSAEQQVAMLATPPPGTGTRMQPLIIPPIEDDIMEDLRFFDFAAMNLIVKSKTKSIDSKYYKLVMSLPDEQESPGFSQHLQTFTDIAFPETKHLEMECPPTLLERKTVSSITLTVSLRRLIGVNMLEREVPSEDAVCGMNGFIFVMYHKSMDVTRKRLYKLVKLKKHYSVIPLAVLISKQVEESQVEEQLQLHSLSQETGIKFNLKYFILQKGPSGLSNMFLKAVDWLTSVHESVVTPYCTSAYFLVNTAIRMYLWDRFMNAEALPYDDCDKIKLSLYMTINIHNRACKELCYLLTQDEVNSYTIGAPEFEKFIPVDELNSAGYRVMPPYYGSPQYKQMLNKLLKSAEFVMPPTQPLTNKQEFDQLLFNLCRLNQISKRTHRKIDEYVSICTRFLNPRSDGWINVALKKLSWIVVLKHMMSDRMKRLNFMDTLHGGSDERPILVAANRLRLSEFISEQWYIFIREKGQAMSKETLALKWQFGPEMSHQSANSDETAGRSGLKRKRKTFHQGLSPSKRLKTIIELPDIESISDLNFGKSKEEIEQFMKCKKEVENLGSMIAECSRKQNILDIIMKNGFFGLNL